MSGWIGVDLDGTLATFGGWKGGEIGEPVPAMVERVQQWIREGKEVKIFTARVASTGMVNEQGQADDQEFVSQQRELIQAWCVRHIGVSLRVTATKDFAMIELWDDRAVRVEMNTGRVLGGAS